MTLAAAGIPLTLVTVANVAKFLSEIVFFIHYNAWKLYLRIKNRKRRRAAAAEAQKLLSERASEQEVLDKVRLIRFPPIVVFMFVIVYGFFAAYIIYVSSDCYSDRNWSSEYLQRREKWSYLESCYFIFISILTVGMQYLHQNFKNNYRQFLVEIFCR